MAHNLEIVNGVAQMAYVGETPWHGLGAKVEAGELDLKAAGLDWHVVKNPLYASTDGGDMIEIPGKQALMRSTDKRILSIVGNDWNPVQNHEAFEFFQEFIEAGDMTMHTAGSLKDGEMVWALAKVNDGFTIKTDQGEDTVESYLLFSNPHSYGKAIDVRFTPIRVVCNNTLTLSLNQNVDNFVRMSHQHPFDPDAAKEALGMAKEKLATYKEAAQHLCQKRYTEDQVVEYFDTIFPTAGKRRSNKAVAAQGYKETQAGAEFGRGTFWELYNTVTYMTNHVLGNSQDGRLRSNWYGHSAKVNKKALELAVNM